VDRGDVMPAAAMAAMTCAVSCAEVCVYIYVGVCLYMYTSVRASLCVYFSVQISIRACTVPVWDGSAR
jgi:hypothetical protein